MVSYYVPTPAEFRAGALEHYGFLISEFGFADRPASESADPKYSACFRKDALYVLVEGFSYGFALGTQLGRSEWFHRQSSELALGFLIRLRRPDLLAPRFGENRGQLEEMAFQAHALRECAADFLTGDLSAWASVLAAQAAESDRNRMDSDALERRRAVDRVAARASAAFRSGQYAVTIALLQPHQEALTNAESTMLQLALRRSSDAA